jgi:hypothetical protein
MIIRTAKDLIVYGKAEEHSGLTAEVAEVGKMLGAMIKTPEKFLTSDFRLLERSGVRRGTNNDRNC